AAANRMTAIPMTRGVVFRSVSSALGGGERDLLIDALSGSELQRALIEAGPLDWLPTELFTRLLAVAPEHVEREWVRRARATAGATVRESFLRFSPGSAATRLPERTLATIRSVWAQYQSWGTIASMPVQADEVVVRLVGTLRDPVMCAWT